MKEAKSPVAPDDALDRMYRGPGYLIRRAQQIASAAFTEACKEVDLTPSQYWVLSALRHRGLVGQNELGRMVYFDRCTTSVVVAALTDRGVVARSQYPNDRRRTLLSLTNSGRRLLFRAERLSSGVSEDLLSVFSNSQARTFVELLETFVKANERHQKPYEEPRNAERLAK